MIPIYKRVISLKNIPHRLDRLCSISELEAIFSIVLQTVLSSSIDKTQRSTDFILETIKTRSSGV